MRDTIFCTSFLEKLGCKKSLAVTWESDFILGDVGVTDCKECKQAETS